MKGEQTVINESGENVRLNEALKHEVQTIIDIADHLITAFQRGNKVLLMGNGGSAADAQHIAGELAGKFYRDREPLPAIALTTDGCSLTAIANDYGYEEVFARQIVGLAKSGDIVIGMSTSGNSENILRAVELSKQLGCITVGFTGDSGKLKELVDLALSVPSTETPRIQEVHLTAGHIICHLVEEALFGDSQTA